MPKRSSRTPHVDQAAFEMVRRPKLEQVEQPAREVLIISEPKPSKYDVSRVMAEMGRKGGRIGGKRRLETMTVMERKRIAKKAANARWKNRGTELS